MRPPAFKVCRFLQLLVLGALFFVQCSGTGNAYNFKALNSKFEDSLSELERKANLLKKKNNPPIEKEWVEDPLPTSPASDDKKMEKKKRGAMASAGGLLTSAAMALLAGVIVGRVTAQETQGEREAVQTERSQVLEERPGVSLGERGQAGGEEEGDAEAAEARRLRRAEPYYYSGAHAPGGPYYPRPAGQQQQAVTPHYTITEVVDVKAMAQWGGIVVGQSILLFVVLDAVMRATRPRPGRAPGPFNTFFNAAAWATIMFSSGYTVMVGQTISPPKSSSTGGGSSSSSPERLSRAALNLVQVPNPQQWVQWAEEWYRQLPLPRWAPDDTVPLVLGWVAARVFQVVSVSRVWHLVRRDYEHPALELMVFTHVVGDQWLRVLLGRRQLGQAVGLAVAYASLALFTFLAILLEDVLSGILFLPSLLYIVFIVALNVSSWRLDAEKRANPVKPYPVTYVRQEIMQ